MGKIHVTGLHVGGLPCTSDYTRTVEFAECGVFAPTCLPCSVLWMRRQVEIKVGDAEDEDLARSAELDSILLLVADVIGKAMLDIGIFPLAAGREAAIQIATE